MEPLLNQFQELTSFLPPEWRVTHLILLQPEWQCNITDGEYVAVGTGATPEEAITNAALKALDEQFVGRLFSRELMAPDEPKASASDLAAALGLRKAPNITRRI